MGPDEDILKTQSWASNNFQVAFNKQRVLQIE